MQERVVWRRVALFYGIAFGMVALLSAVLAALHARFDVGSARAVFQLTVAFLYMPMPLVAGLVVERIAGRPALIRKTWAQFRANWRRIVVISALCPLAIYALNLTLTYLLGNMLGVPGVGRLVFSADAVMANIAQIVPKDSLGGIGTVPPVGLLLALGAVGGLSAGFTINGLFAFGEEYGWRGVLADELRPLGSFRANLLTGVLWGLWHAPLIVLGFNYDPYRASGILMMCVWLVPFSFLLWRTREYADSVVPAAIIHGALNGSAGVFLFAVADRNPLVSSPIGLTGALAIAIVAAVAWWLTRAGVAEQKSRQGTFAA